MERNLGKEAGITGNHLVVADTDKENGTARFNKLEETVGVEKEVDG